MHASGILAVVMAAFSMSVNLTLDPKHQYPGGYRTRLQEEQVWRVLDFLLETFVFAYIGLQLKFVLEGLSEDGDPGLVRTLVAAAIPEFTRQGEPFPGRDAIQVIALIVTLGTLLVQGTSVGWLARRLRFDLAAENAEEERLRAVGRAVVADTT